MPIELGSSDTQFITLGEVKAHANIPSSQTSHDVELDMIRGSAEEVVQGLIGPVLWRTVVEVVRPRSGAAILSTLPVQSVTSVVNDGAVVSGYTLNGRAGLVEGVETRSALTVTYVAGRAVVPDAVRLAALIIAGHLWQTQRSGAPSALPSQDFDVPMGLGFAIPARALDLLQPYLLPPAIA